MPWNFIVIRESLLQIIVGRPDDMRFFLFVDRAFRIPKICAAPGFDLGNYDLILRTAEDQINFTVGCAVIAFQNAVTPADRPLGSILLSLLPENLPFIVQGFISALPDKFLRHHQCGNGF